MFSIQTQCSTGTIIRHQTRDKDSFGTVTKLSAAMGADICYALVDFFLGLTVIPRVLLQGKAESLGELFDVSIAFQTCVQRHTTIFHVESTAATRWVT